MVAQKRVVIYAWVSTLDEGQAPETQLVALRDCAERRGFRRVGEYIDYASGMRNDRPEYQALLDVARKRQVDQENIDTTTPQGKLIFMGMASLAQFERALISERVKAGMARARVQGKRISWAPIPDYIQDRVVDLYKQGTSIHQISQMLGGGYGTAWNYV